MARNGTAGQYSNPLFKLRAVVQLSSPNSNAGRDALDVIVLVCESDGHKMTFPKDFHVYSLLENSSIFSWVWTCLTVDHMFIFFARFLSSYQFVKYFCTV